MHGLTPESQDNLLIGQTNKSLQSGRNPNRNKHSSYLIICNIMLIYLR